MRRLKKRRRASEIAYESRRKELGLPSLEVSRQRDAFEREQIERDLEQTRGAERETESYWRSRASELRADIAAVDAELNFTRARLDEVSSMDSGTMITTVDPFDPYGNVGTNPYGNVGNRRSNYPNMRREPVYGYPRTGTQIPGRDGNRERGARRRGVYNQWPFPQERPIWGDSPYPSYPNGGPYGSNQAYDYTYERSALVTRFNELSATRAGLSARWRELEEEARRAGASPGWLRP